MNTKTTMITTLAAMLTTGAVASAAEEDVSKRITALEEQVRELQANQYQLLSVPDVHLGGYGELHYNDLSGKGGADDKEEIDFHRFVLFIGYDFSDRIRFVSEVELEHSVSGGDEPGEVELEQAYIDFDLMDTHTARAGLFLMPVGLLNQSHEPPRFYGVERNPVENKILPTTWWEAGAGLHGNFAPGWDYAAYVHSGLKTSTNSSYAVRSGRQKAAKADASDLATTLALNWSTPGLLIGGSVQYQSDMTQSEDPAAGSAWMGELHTDAKIGAFAVRALYGQWELDGDGPESMDADQQYGWYIEPSYRICDPVGVFVRYSEWDNQAGSSTSESEKTEVSAGINWWPHEQVVLKADYQWQDNENAKEQNGVNLGLGLEF